MIKIKQLAHEHEAAALPLLQAFFAEMRYADMGEEFDPATVAQNLRQFIQSPAARLFGAWQCGRLVGIGGCVLAPSLTSRAHLKAVEMVWHADPKLHPRVRAGIMIKMTEALEAWALAAGARSFHFSIPATLESVGKFLGRRGFILREHQYSKPLTPH